jgi:hypothetical protein
MTGATLHGAVSPEGGGSRAVAELVRQARQRVQDLAGVHPLRHAPLLYHTQYFQSRFAKVNSPTNPSTYPVLVLI